MKYACVCIDGTGGRCREVAIDTPEGAFICSGHLREKPEDLKMAPKPHWVLAKFSGKESFLGYLQENCPDLEKKDHDWYELNRDHGKSAEEFGRNPHQFDKHRNDDGVLVFGKDGLSNVGELDGVIAEMQSCGYYLAKNIHWFYTVKPDKQRRALVHGAVLVFSFVLDRTHALVPGVDLLAEMTSSAWQFVHVWANPPRESGEILHTVNCTGRQEGRGKNILKFLNGLWYCLPREADDGTSK